MNEANIAGSLRRGLGIGWGERQNLEDKLWLAIQAHDVEDVKMLLTKGANPNGIEDGGVRRSFLLRCLRMDKLMHKPRLDQVKPESLAIARLLVKAGADLSVLAEPELKALGIAKSDYRDLAKRSLAREAVEALVRL